LTLASNYYHRFDIAARKAGEAVEEANQAFDKAKGTYNEFSDAVNGYE
jgi:hypothetical protein